MPKIFFGNKLVRFASEPGKVAGVAVDAACLFDSADPLAKLLENLENNNSAVIVTPFPREDFNRFISGLKVIEAAGGFVRSQFDETLMIRRSHNWDLPKGHVEDGEEYEHAAVREVGEECGITGIDIGDQLTDTYHTYFLNGRMVVKRTRWYRMSAPRQSTVPQREEGIVSAEWVPDGRLSTVLADTWRSVREVFDSAGIYVEM